jgi:hypothetical protein
VLCVCVFFFCRQNCRARFYQNTFACLYFFSLSVRFVLSGACCVLWVFCLFRKRKNRKIQNTEETKKKKRPPPHRKKKQLFLLTLSHFLSLQRQTLSSLFSGRRDEAEEEGRVRRRRGYQPHRRLSIESVETSELCSSQVNEFSFSLPFFSTIGGRFAMLNFLSQKKANWGKCVCACLQRLRTRIFFVSAPLPSHRVEKKSVVDLCVCVHVCYTKTPSFSLSSNFVSGRSAGLFFSQFITDNKIHTRKK